MRGGTPALCGSHLRGSLRLLAREEENDNLTPLAKTRAALESKAAKGDVQAARELREHHDHYYGSAAGGDAWPALLGTGADAPVPVPVEAELATVRAIIDAALKRPDSQAE